MNSRFPLYLLKKKSAAAGLRVVAMLMMSHIKAVGPA